MQLFKFILKGVLQGTADEQMQNSPQPKSFLMKCRMRGYRPIFLSARPLCFQIVNFLPSWPLEFYKIGYSYTVCEGEMISTCFYDKDFTRCHLKDELKFAKLTQTDKYVCFCKETEKFNEVFPVNVL